MSIADLYSQGGVLMHFILLWYLAAIASMVMHAVKKAGRRGESRYVDVADRCIWAGVCVGILGSALNATEWLGGLMQLDDISTHIKPVLKTCMVNLYPVTFAMIMAATSTMATVILRLGLRTDGGAEAAQAGG